MSVPTYRETLEYLYRLQWRGMKFGLRNTRELLRHAGNPHRRFPSLHVAGTNGKGSTSAFLASIAREAGLKTGLYTSPHLVRFTERIRVDGAELSEERLVYYVKDLRRTIESVHATFFEATTCAAFQFFADEHVDLAVIETGLGGRFDATNVLFPLASVITSIGLDHTQYLGSTLEQIAVEKGGIIKPGTPVVAGVIADAPLRILRRIARRRHAPFSLASRSAACTVVRKKGQYRMAFQTGLAKGQQVTPGLPGLHQIANARAAAAVFSVLSRRPCSIAVDSGAIIRGISRVVGNTGLRARLEMVDAPGGLCILDVAHNPDGIRTLVQALKGERVAPAAVLFGVMADKDYRTMLHALRPLAASLVAVAPAMERALPVGEVARHARDAGFEVLTAPSIAAGLRRARLAAGRKPVLVTGSHYVVAEAVRALENQKS